MESKRYTTLLDFALITLGSTVFAVAVVMFLNPYNIVPGGVTGVAMILCELIPVLPLGATILVINAPLFFLSWKLLGHKFLLYTAFGTVVSSVAIDLLTYIVPPVETEPLLAGVFGGVISGAGLGLVFIRGATTGGSDIIARLLKVPFPHVQIGRLMLVFDGCVVIASGMVFRSVNSMLYAAIALYISTKALDSILYGMNIERVAYIISDKYTEIVNEISESLERGATLLHGEGAFSGAPKRIVLCAIKRQQITQIKTIVKRIDPKAFMILTDAGEVLGEGFADYAKNI